MTTYKISYKPRAKLDITQTVDYYNFKQKGLGKIFYEALKREANKLKTNPFYQIRYEQIRCLPLEKFPYMIHFEIDEENKIVRVYGIICTHQNPDDAWIF
jgi:hypothetical protein